VGLEGNIFVHQTRLLAKKASLATHNLKIVLIISQIQDPQVGHRNPVDTSFRFSKDKSTKKSGLAFATSAIANST